MNRPNYFARHATPRFNNNGANQKQVASVQAPFHPTANSKLMSVQAKQTFTPKSFSSLKNSSTVESSASKLTLTPLSSSSLKLEVPTPKSDHNKSNSSGKLNLSMVSASSSSYLENGKVAEALKEEDQINVDMSILPFDPEVEVEVDEMPASVKKIIDKYDPFVKDNSTDHTKNVKQRTHEMKREANTTIPRRVETEVAVILEESSAIPEKKFASNSRLFIGNIPNDFSEEQFVQLFSKYGEYKEPFLNAARSFGFVKMDTRHNAELVRSKLDGALVKNGRLRLRVRFAGNTTALRVKHLSQFVCNEMLEDTFKMFGEVERAIIVLDERGKPTGEGIVEFARKNAAFAALKKISEGVFLMTATMRPIEVEPLEMKDETHGISDIFIPKNAEYLREMEQQPRFAQRDSVEFSFGMKWKKLYQIYKEQSEQLKKNFEEEVEKIEIEQSTASIEQQAYLIRKDLLQKQEELRMLEEQAKREVQRRMEHRQLGENARNADAYRRPLEAPANFSNNGEQQFGVEREKLQRPPDRLQQHQSQGPTPLVSNFDRQRMGLNGPANCGGSAPQLHMQRADVTITPSLRTPVVMPAQNNGQGPYSLMSLRAPPPSNAPTGPQHRTASNTSFQDTFEAKRLRRF